MLGFSFFLYVQTFLASENSGRVDACALYVVRMASTDRTDRWGKLVEQNAELADKISAVTRTLLAEKAAIEA